MVINNNIHSRQGFQNPEKNDTQIDEWKRNERHKGPNAANASRNAHQKRKLSSSFPLGHQTSSSRNRRNSVAKDVAETRRQQPRISTMKKCIDRKRRKVRKEERK